MGVDPVDMILNEYLQRGSDATRDNLALPVEPPPTILPSPVVTPERIDWYAQHTQTQYPDGRVVKDTNIGGSLPAKNLLVILAAGALGFGLGYGFGMALSERR